MNIREKVFEQVEAIFDLTVNENKHEQEVSEELDIPTYAVRGIQSLIARYQKEENYSKILEYREKYETGEINIAHIAYDTGFSIGTVTKILREAGAKGGRAVNTIQISKEEIEDLYHNQGKSLAELSTELKASIPAIRKKFDEYGINVRSKGRPKKEEGPISAAPVNSIDNEGNEDDRKPIDMMNMKELRMALEELELPVDGTRDELIERLAEAQ